VNALKKCKRGSQVCKHTAKARRIVSRTDGRWDQLLERSGESGVIEQEWGGPNACIFYSFTIDVHERGNCDAMLRHGCLLECVLDYVKLNVRECERVHVCRGEWTRVGACVVKSTCATGSEWKRVTYADGLGASKRVGGAME
jgi:hypothetical protein